MPRRLLIVDPDRAARRQVRAACEEDGYEVVEAGGRAQALARFRESRPWLVLLEVALPDGSGFEICSELRALDQHVGIILVSSEGDEREAVTGLELGADDYLVKPVRLRELVARVGATLRRVRMGPPAVIPARLEFTHLVIDPGERRVIRGGEEVKLTHTEFDLLWLLARNAGRVLTREAILEQVWASGPPLEAETRVIDVHVRNLRKKIEAVPSRPVHILAVPGIGYRFTNAG
ncbi:MAG: response regulator transcription factor [Candidatus Dormibacteraeota bacterium]|nr:response regulator transcription factor [Candidatus Dormibacteraeota bacterium]